VEDKAQPRLVSPQVISDATRPGFLASNQKVILFVALQVLIIGSFIAWRKHRINHNSSSGGHKAQV